MRVVRRAGGGRFAALVTRGGTLAALAFVVATPALVHGADQAAVCKNRKGRAVGRYTLSVSRAFGKNKKAPNTANLAEDLAKAQAKLTKSFTRAEFSGYFGSLGCETTGDVGVMESKADSFVADLLDELCPPACGGPFVGECNGACPPGAVCSTQDLSTCTCISSASPCGATAPVCNGECPAGEECITVDSFPLPQCQCAPPGTVLCQNSAFPVCGGLCPAGQECFPGFGSPSSGGVPFCGCAATGSVCGGPSCFGSCPAGFACAVVPPCSNICAPIP
jgi:hypothetical protein